MFAYVNKYPTLRTNEHNLNLRWIQFENFYYDVVIIEPISCDYALAFM